MLGLWSLAAGAAQPVVYAGIDPDVAVARVVVATERPARDFQPIALDMLVAGRPPALQGVGRLARCEGAPISGAAVGDAVGRAEASASYAEYAKVLSELGTIAGSLACLSEPADPAALSRLHFLRGVSAFHSGDKAAAWAAFQQAFFFQPALAWDADFAPDPKPIFDLVAKEIATTPAVGLDVVPSPAGLRVDGSEVNPPVRVVPGPHLVQTAGGTSVVVEADPAGDARLVVPQDAKEAALAAVVDAAGRTAFGAVLEASLGPGIEVFVAQGSRVWRVTTGADAWQEVGAGVVAVLPPAVAAAPPPSPPVSSSARPDYLLWGGAAGLALGGVVAGIGYAGAAGAVADGDAAEDWAAWDEANDRRSAAVRTYWIGAGVAAAGAAVVGADFVLSAGPTGIAIHGRLP